MQREIEQKILAYERRKIDGLRPPQLGVHGKFRYPNLVDEFLEARNAAQFDRLVQ